MEYIVQGLRQSVYDETPLPQVLEQRLGLEGVSGVTIERESLDARKKPDVIVVYHLRFTVADPSQQLRRLLERGQVKPYLPEALPPAEPHLALPERPIIVGFGPAGMFAALWLARMGYRPLVLERGQPVAQRAQAVRALWQHGVLDPESNLQFGEGGAGTWSDGKLTTGKRSPLDRLILEDLVAAGAPDTILYRAKPHIGTDYLHRLVGNIRQEITDLGGEVRFGARLSQLYLRNGSVSAVSVAGEKLRTKTVIMAIGHSARDTVTMLAGQGVAMTPKPFALGTRVEHPAALINTCQYGAQAAARLGAADYKLVFHHGANSVFSFCMCPGGQVVCAASEAGGQVTNGMSHYARDKNWSNSALVVSVDPDALGLHTVEDAIAFQRGHEQRAYQAGGGGFCAPAQRAQDFLRGVASTALPETTYQPGVAAADLAQVLPTMAVAPLQAALQHWDRAMPGFVAQGVLIGLESRTSSPVRILRDEQCQSVSTPGLYLLGEGSGYAGGIMTCARDAVSFCRSVLPRR